MQVGWLSLKTGASGNAVSVISATLSVASCSDLGLVVSSNFRCTVGEEGLLFLWLKFPPLSTMLLPSVTTSKERYRRKLLSKTTPFVGDLASEKLVRNSLLRASGEPCLPLEWLAGVVA
jgi:hypothetical protein